MRALPGLMAARAAQGFFEGSPGKGVGREEVERGPPERQNLIANLRIATRAIVRPRCSRTLQRSCTPAYRHARE